MPTLVPKRQDYSRAFNNLAAFRRGNFRPAAGGPIMHRERTGQCQQPVVESAHIGRAIQRSQVDSPAVGSSGTERDRAEH